MRLLLTIVAFLAAFGMAAHATLLQFVTLATNDPRDYQPLLKSGVLWSGLAVLAMVLFVASARGRWRVAAVLPLAICCVGWWGIANMWPYAFV